MQAVDLLDGSLQGDLAAAWRLCHPVPAVRRLGADELSQLGSSALAGCGHVVARQLPDLLAYLNERAVQVAACRALAAVPATLLAGAACEASVVELRDALASIVGGAFDGERRAAAWAALSRLPPGVLWPVATRLLRTAAAEDADMAASAIALNEGVLARVSGSKEFGGEARFAELNTHVRALGRLARSPSTAAAVRRGAIVVMAIRAYLFGDSAAEAASGRCASARGAQQFAALVYANADRYFYAVQGWARKFVLDAARSNSEWVIDPVKTTALRRAAHRAHAMLCVAAITDGALASKLAAAVHAGLRDEHDEVVLHSVRALNRVPLDADVERLLSGSRVHASLQRSAELRIDVANDALDALARVSTAALAEHAELLRAMLRGTVRVTMAAETQASELLARVQP